MADTNVHYFNGTFMIFATHDFDINNTGFTMKDCERPRSSPRTQTHPHLPPAGSHS
jgi:hypothetical protein